MTQLLNFQFALTHFFTFILSHKLAISISTEQAKYVLLTNCLLHDHDHNGNDITVEFSSMHSSL